MNTAIRSSRRGKAALLFGMALSLSLSLFFFYLFKRHLFFPSNMMNMMEYGRNYLCLSGCTVRTWSRPRKTKTTQSSSSSSTNTSITWLQTTRRVSIFRRASRYTSLVRYLEIHVFMLTKAGEQRCVHWLGVSCRAFLWSKAFCYFVYLFFFLPVSLDFSTSTMRLGYVI